MYVEVCVCARTIMNSLTRLGWYTTVQLATLLC